MINLLITGAYRYTPEQIQRLSELGAEVDHVQFEKDGAKLPDKYDAVVCNGLFLHQDISEFKNLKYIQLTSAGLDRVPLKEIREREIELHNARGVYSIPMAEHAVMKIMELYKNSRKFYRNQDRHEWIKDRELTELYGKSAAIVGCGSVGIECAIRLKAFGVDITGVDIFECKSPYIDRYVHIDDIKKAIAECDIAILTLPLTEQTRHMFDGELFSVMRPGAVIVNISRGGVVDQTALVSALENGEIAGTALDVFENEPLDAKSRLWDMENVIITPHNSFVGDGNHRRMFEVIYNNLKDWINNHENNGRIS